MPTKLAEIVTTHVILVQELLTIVIFVLKIELTHLNTHAQMDTLIMELPNTQNVAQLVKIVKPPIATVKMFRWQRNRDRWRRKRYLPMPNQII